MAGPLIESFGEKLPGLLETYAIPIFQRLIGFVGEAVSFVQAIDFAALWDSIVAGGSTIKPIFDDVVEFFQTNVVPVFDLLVTYFENYIPLAIKMASEYFDVYLKPVFESLVEQWKTNVQPAFVDLVAFLDVFIPKQSSKSASFGTRY